MNMINWFYGTQTNVTEDKEKYVIEIDAIGIPKSEIKVEIKNGILKVDGKSRWTTIAERYRLPLDEVNLDGITAEASDGILTIVIPKQIEQEKGIKLIEVK